MSAPVDLLYTANPVLTICTYCVAPTAPLGSGGAQAQKLARSPLPRPMPPKPSEGLGVSGAPGVVCRAPSGTSGPAFWPGMRSGRSGEPLNALTWAGRSRAAGDTPCCMDEDTSRTAPDEGAAFAALGAAPR